MVKRTTLPAVEPTEYLAIQQAADRLNVSSRTVYDLCRLGKTAHLRIGIGRGTIRIPLRALRDFEDAAEVKPPPVLSGGLAELLALKIGDKPPSTADESRSSTKGARGH